MRARKRGAPRGAAVRTAPKPEAARVAAASARGPGAETRELLGLVLAALAVVAFYLVQRWRAPLPWSYDEYYHLGVARELAAAFPLARFHWTPFSIFATAFADKEPLFHLLLRPFASWPLERATLVACLIGQVFVVGSFAFVLTRLRVPRPWFFVLALAALGPLVGKRLDMCRPHLWLIGFAVLLLGLLLSAAPWWLLAVVSALFGLAHTGGWIGIPFAALWTLVAWRERPPGERARLWLPLAAITGGWLGGQLVHPNFPANLRLAWLQNFYVLFQASASGNAALRSQLGTELAPPSAAELLDQWWPLGLAGLLVVWLLAEPRARRGAPLVATAIAIPALLAGSFFAFRFFELGAPLALLALALVARERQAAGRPFLATFGGLALAVGAVLLGAIWSWKATSAFGFGRHSPPQAMARWLGENGPRGERVFTAQWADSAPLLYYAPQLESLVALDPTFFYVADPARFETYVRIVEGRHAAPARTIREDFGARWATVWKAPLYRRLAEELAATPGARVVFNDRDYLVFDLGGTGGAGS